MKRNLLSFKNFSKLLLLTVGLSLNHLTNAQQTDTVIDFENGMNRILVEEAPNPSTMNVDGSGLTFSVNNTISNHEISIGTIPLFTSGTDQALIATGFGGLASSFSIKSDDGGNFVVESLSFAFVSTNSNVITIQGLRDGQVVTGDIERIFIGGIGIFNLEESDFVSAGGFIKVDEVTFTLSTPVLGNFGIDDILLAEPDESAPQVESISLQGDPTANDESITYLVTFDENAENISVNDFELTTVSGNTTGTIANISAMSGTTVEVTVEDLVLEGEVRLDLIAMTDIQDTLDNVGPEAFISGDVHTVDFVAPSGYSAQIDLDIINLQNVDALSFTFENAEVGTTYEYTIISDAGGTAVTGMGNVTLSGETVSNIDISGLEDGNVRLDFKLIDAVGNLGEIFISNTVLKDTEATSAPIITIVEDTDNDGIISPTEFEGEIDLLIALPIDAVAGDTLIIGDSGGEIEQIILNPNDIANGEVMTNVLSFFENGELFTVTAVIIDQAGNSSSESSDSARKDSITGIFGGNFSSINLYPNPSAGLVTIESEVINVRVSDLSGIVILETTENTFDISTLSPAVYVINVQTEEGMFIQQLIKE